MDPITEIKTKADIYSIARKLGFIGNKVGSVYQGNCFHHTSTGGNCLNIWPSSQQFNCFNCNEHGDVINLVQLAQKCDFRVALTYLAEQVGVELPEAKSMSAEERLQLESGLAEKRLVENMLTAATEWYHSQLEVNQKIKEWLLVHYGFSENIINELQVGFAPAHEGTSPLAEHLANTSEFKGKLHLCGLFNFKEPGGPYFDHFRGRITFPYWKHGKVVYMAGRATAETPNDKYESYNKREKENNDGATI